MNKNYESVKKLIEKGKKITNKNENSENIIEYSLRKGCLDISILKFILNISTDFSLITEIEVQ